MVQVEARVVDRIEEGRFVRVALAAPEIVPALSAGRFVLADLGAYLREPLFPAGMGEGEFEVLVPLDHPLAALRAGGCVDLVGPLGRGFEVDEEVRRLLLVAGAAHLPVLLPLARQAAREGTDAGRSVALLLSAPTAAGLYPVRLLPPALEVHVATADGSAGHGGSSLDLLPDLVRWADCVCIADGVETYLALAKVVREVRMRPGRRFAQALIVPPMACGMGACQGCAVRVGRGIKLACTDGPVFDLLELRYD